jgi:hypothetical protein
MIQKEHEHHVTERRRVDTIRLAEMLSYKVVGASREDLLELLANPKGARLAAILHEPATPGNAYERTYDTDAGRYVLVPSGSSPPEYAGAVVPLVEIAEDFHAQKERARRNSGWVEMPGTSQEVIAREKQRLAAGLTERLAMIDEDLPAIAMAEISHLRLSEEECTLIEATLKTGDERAQEELMLIRRFVAGPNGDLEPAVTLHRWTPEAGRPDRHELGAGAKIMNLVELRQAAHERAIAKERYGEPALAEFRQFNEPII